MSNTTEDKPRWPIEQARAIAMELVHFLEPGCERIEIAGSIRRRKPMVGDIELVYVPRFGAQKAGPGDLFADERMRCNEADVLIAELERSRVLERRLNAKGREMFGQQNKLMREVSSGIPVDLFATTAECWFNYLVCRTGGAENNMTICVAAQRMGWKWTPYGSGFERGPDPGQRRRIHTITSEREVFEFVGLAYREPHERT